MPEIRRTSTSLGCVALPPHTLPYPSLSLHIDRLMETEFADEQIIRSDGRDIPKSCHLYVFSIDDLAFLGLLYM